MNYKAFYRTYRPTNFDEVVGQDHIVRTLVNLIKMDKISHGYLFCGPKGTGKTSVAKIFANAINCIHAEKKEDICERCKKTMNANLDVIEMDAASNNSVNDIRTIRDQVEFVPTNSRYKIYIIDEAHMLTHGAFNALLMTLEEPPKHVIFILATTDPDKIPDTILSRVQRYNFKRIAKDVVEKQLKQILDQEKIEYDDESIEAISSLSNGSLRDALSIADQLNAYTNSKINIQQVMDVFGLSTLESQINLVNLIAKKQIGPALEYFDSLILNGNDINKLVVSLINLLKDYLIYKKTSNLNLTKIKNQKLLDQIVLKSESTYKVLDVLIQLLIDIKSSDIPQQLCHLAIIKISSFEENLVDVEKREDNYNIYTNLDTKKDVQGESLDITEEYFRNQKLDGNNQEEKVATNNKNNETQTLLSDFSKTKIQEDIKEIFNDFVFDKDKENATNTDIFNQTDEVTKTKTLETIQDESILDQTTELLNLSNEEDGFEQEINETLLISADANNTKPTEIYDTNEISISAMDQTDLISDNKEITKEVESPEVEKTKEFNIEELEKNNVEQTTLSQHDIVNLFLLSKKETFEIFKDRLNKATVAPEEEFDSYSVLIKEVKFICSANDFILVSSNENWVINDINQKNQEPKFKSFIFKYFGNNIHFFAITKNEYTLSKELFKELQKHDKIPAPRQLDLINLISNEDDLKKEMEINEVESKSKLLFGNLFSRKKE